MTASETMLKTLRGALLDRSFLSGEGITREQMIARMDTQDFADMAAALPACAGAGGRFAAPAVLELCLPHVPELQDVPPEGWLEHCRLYLRGLLFPHLGSANDAERYRRGRSALLQLLRGVYRYERETLPFHPTRDMQLLSDTEIESGGYLDEYPKFHRLARSHYVYEFMRISADLTPFNTVGHISGVHYVALYAARQLVAVGIPVDLGLISAAAAAHDIGKYGCRPEEERRVPYLHYYYTDLCLQQFGLPAISHIAANHSTWDLELENLSIEALLLIYADFRVKSSRDANGEEIIHFYSLAEAFGVILGKLDNVDAAKRQRYVRVYNKLHDFEAFMEENGVVTALPEDYAPLPAAPGTPRHREVSLLHDEAVVQQLKFRAIEHNIRLMQRFSSTTEFSTLMEAARGETRWRDLRTYISILGEYSTYMTEQQKNLTLDFLCASLAHRESDIREQAARIMGRIITHYREDYKKELPADIPAPDSAGTNLYAFERYLAKVLQPSRKYTEQHRQRIQSSADFFVQEVIRSCRPVYRERYLHVLAEYYEKENAGEYIHIVLCSIALAIDLPELPADFLSVLTAYVRRILGSYTVSLDLIALFVAEKHFPEVMDFDIEARQRNLVDIPIGSILDEELLSSRFLDNLKVNTSWIIKLVNIDCMMEVAERGGNLLQMATHFANLSKVSETVTVRRRASAALLELIDRMPLDQRNELGVELFNGLELGDYQFSRFIPDLLGVLILHLPGQELDEHIYELEKLLNAGAEKSACAALNTIAVALEHYREFTFAEDAAVTDARRRHLLGILLKGCAHYKDDISQEALRIIGLRLFHSSFLLDEEKHWIAVHSFKRLLAVIPSGGSDSGLAFYNNAAMLNELYRFISYYLCDVGPFAFETPDKVAFFPGTFDPFSLGHKAIATTIRDLGFEVYLALDEFSWSKKTLPHMLRRKILHMSVSDEEGLNVFPKDLPVNIANPEDLATLRAVFADKTLYIAVGSDVVANASSYRKPPEPNSIHSFNHIIFARASKDHEPGGDAQPIAGHVLHLTLRKYYEDISSTRIRYNIDLGRDIGNLLDPVAQNFIYDQHFYAREPAYKHVLQAQELTIYPYEHRAPSFLLPLREELEHRGYAMEALLEHLDDEAIRTLYIESGKRHRRITAFAAARRVKARELFAEIGDSETTYRIRRMAQGSIALISAFFVSQGRSITNLNQILLTELLTGLLAKDYALAIYQPADPAGMNAATIEALRRQGFTNISADPEHPLYAVDMKAPVVIFRDVETVIKAPLNKNPRVIRALDEAHGHLLNTFTALFPGQLILSFNTSAVYSRIVRLVAEENGVDTVPDPEHRRGPYMSVPFGKALADVVVPNTVTKALRTEKYFANDLSGFTIREWRNYAPLPDQIRTIRSFHRPVILIDDLLHKGQRVHQIVPLLQEQGIEIRKIIVGLLTGRALDSLTEKGLDVTGAYFLPSIRLWLNERDCYPFIGGDSIELVDGGSGSRSINMILPYTSFSFVGREDADAVYRYSMTCLENAASILRVLEQEYQANFGKKLTLDRLGAVISWPHMPVLGLGLSYDGAAAPSQLVENDIRRTKRLHLVKA